MIATTYSFSTPRRPIARVYAIKWNGQYTGDEFATSAAAFRRIQELAKLCNTSALCFRVEEILL